MYILLCFLYTIFILSGTSAYAIKDIYGFEIPAYNITIGDLEYTVLETPQQVNQGPYQRLNDGDCPPKVLGFGYLRVAGIKPRLPKIISGNVTVSQNILNELMFPLHSAVSMCCAARCPTSIFDNGVYMEGWPILYQTTIGCRKVNSTEGQQNATISFIGDDFWCTCSTGAAKPWRQSYVFCPITPEGNNDYCCTPFDLQCPKVPDWAKDIFKK